MLKIPLAEIISRIKEASRLSEDEINERINSKLSQLSGLISKEGAAYIIANELGIKLLEQQQRGKLQIKNILSGMRSVEVVGKIQRLFELREFQTETRTGKVASMVIGDETGTIRVAMWGDMADKIKELKEEDIVKIIGGYVRDNAGRKELHLNERSKLIINPPDETVGEIKKFVSERKPIKELSEGNENVEILGTIVQVFDLKFYEVCPECNKRARLEQDGTFSCAEHNRVIPDYSYVINIFLDDGTENIRCVLFRSQAERLLKMNKEQVLQFRSNIQAFEKTKTELLGEMVKLVGRTTKNQMFDRLEFVAQLVFTDPNPEDEIKILEQPKTQPAIN